MNALTKIFVVLLVICSVMLAAGVVVFVNKTEAYKDTVTKSTAGLKREQDEHNATRQELLAAQSNLKSIQAQMQAQIDSLRTAVLTNEKAVNERDVQLAQNANALQNLNLAQVQLTEGLKNSEASRGQILTQLTQARQTMDDLLKKNSDLNAALSDTQNRLDVATRELRNTTEELKLSQDQVSRLTNLAQRNRINVNEQLPGVPATPSANVQGTIKEVQEIGGVPHAVINIGSNQNVAKGMELQVVDKARGEWLGTLTVDTVDTRESTGRLNLKGAVLDQIQAGKTQVVSQVQ